MESMTSDAEMADVEHEMSSRKSSTSGSEPSANCNNEGNNNSLPKEISYAELELLKKLEEQNR